MHDSNAFIFFLFRCFDLEWRANRCEARGRDQSSTSRRRATPPYLLSGFFLRFRFSEKHNNGLKHNNREKDRKVSRGAGGGILVVLAITVIEYHKNHSKQWQNKTDPIYARSTESGSCTIWFFSVFCFCCLCVCLCIFVCEFVASTDSCGGGNGRVFWCGQLYIHCYW